MLGKPIHKPGIIVEEIDGAPSIVSVSKLLVNNGTLTDLGGGVAKVLIPVDIDGGNFTDTYLNTADIDGGTF